METILVLDDDPANLDAIGNVLRSQRYSVLEAPTGLQAIEAGMRCGSLFLFVSDIELPDLSGTEVALALTEFYPHLPVLFMSGNAIADWRSKDRANLKRFTAGRVDFLEKPFSASELKMRVRKLIGRRSQVRIDEQDQGNQAA